MEINELVEGKEYTANEIGCENRLYRIINGKLEYAFNGEEWSETERSYNNVISMDFTEIPQFTPDELTLMKLIDEKYTWIARDSDGSLYVFEREPHIIDGCFNGIGEYTRLFAFSHVFTTIKPGEKFEIVR